MRLNYYMFLTSFLGDIISSKRTSSSSKTSVNEGEGFTAGLQTILKDGVLGLATSCCTMLLKHNLNVLLQYYI